MKPENPLFSHEQFSAAVGQQEQRERLAHSFQTVAAACRATTVTQTIKHANYNKVFQDYSYGHEAEAIPHNRAIYDSMCGYYGLDLLIADTPHDEFEWQGVIAGESRFALCKPNNIAINKQTYDVLRLLNMPKGTMVAPDERGLHIARSYKNGNITMFKMVDNPNYQQHVTRGSSLVDDTERTLAREARIDMRPYIPLPLTREETMAASAELELAAQTYQVNI